VQNTTKRDVNDSSYWVSYHTIFFNPIPKGLKLEYASEEQRQLLNGLVTRVTKLFVFCERDNEKIKIKTWRVQVPFVQITLKDKDDPFGSVIRTDFKNLKLINFDKSVKKLALKYDLNSFEIDYDPLQK